MNRFVLFIVLISLLVGGCTMEKEHGQAFTSKEKAESALVEALEKEFEGRKFDIYAKDKDTYVFEKNDSNASLECYVKDQDGNVSNAGITAAGELWTDYMASYYISQLAKPIEEILNQFDFVENYAITLDDWDESDTFNTLNWSVGDFFEHTRRVYQIKVFLPDKENKETYINQAYNVYDKIFENISEAFDIEFYIEDKYVFREAGTSGIEHLFSNRIHQSIHNHVGDLKKDPKTYFEQDLNPEHAEDDFYSNVFENYGIVWKYLPQKNSGI